LVRKDLEALGVIPLQSLVRFFLIRGLRYVEEDPQCDGRSKATSFAFRDDLLAEEISCALLLEFRESLKCGLEST